MHSSKEPQKKSDPNDSLLGMLFVACVAGPVGSMVLGAAEGVSAIYADRFEAASQRTNGRGSSSSFAMGVKNSLEGSFHRAQTNPALQPVMDFALPYWKRDFMPA